MNDAVHLWKALPFALVTLFLAYASAVAIPPPLYADAGASNAGGGTVLVENSALLANPTYYTLLSNKAYYRKSVIRNGVITAGLIGLFVGGWKLGDYFYEEGKNVYYDYKNAVIPDDVDYYHDRYFTYFDVADGAYLVSEVSAIASVVFFTWGVFDLVNYLDCERRLVNMKVAVTPFSLRVAWSHRF